MTQNMRRNAVTSRIYGGTGHQFVSTGVLASSNVLIARQCPPHTINHKAGRALPTPFLITKEAGQGSALPCRAEGHYLILHKLCACLADALSMQNQHDKEKRNPPTSNRGVTRPLARPLLASVDA